jgi:hypothetical protein
MRSRSPILLMVSFILPYTLSFAVANPPAPTAPTPCILQCVKQMNENNNGCGILPRSIPIRQRCFDDTKATFKACKSLC